jgi:hypothetical protein
MIRDFLSYFIFGGVLALFFLILPIFAILYKFHPGFAKRMDELYEDDPLTQTET